MDQKMLHKATPILLGVCVAVATMMRCVVAMEVSTMKLRRSNQTAFRQFARRYGQVFNAGMVLDVV